MNYIPKDASDRKGEKDNGATDLITVSDLENERSWINTNQVAVLLLLFYIMIGISYYTVATNEFDTLDSVYFSVQTLMTIGYGMSSISSSLVLLSLSYTSSYPTVLKHFLSSHH